MSVTIDSLDIQIRSTAGSAAANIDRLAEALERMRANAKLTAVTNNLNKLSDALSRLQGASTGLSNIRGLAGAMKSLSQVQKSSGFNSLINSLKKLPEIVNQLDPATLSAFTTRMRALASALAPLATQIDKVGTAFSRLPARVSQIVTGTNRMASASRNAADAQDEHNRSLNVLSLNLATGIANIESYIGALNMVRDYLVNVMADAIEWDGIQFRFGRAFGEDADMVYDYVMEISEALKINAQQFMQYSSLYGSLLQGFGLSQDKVTTISIGLTELSYDIWAAYNDRYKTLEDASEAVRSAITGEIEPIRNAGIALTEASMQEYLDTIGMATVSIEKLSEAQKAEVRYAVMVNSAMQQGIVGTYAREMQTAEGAVRTLTQQLKTLGQAIGSLFIPILQVVVPWLSAFVQVLTEAIAAVAEFFGIPFFEIQWDSGNVGGGISDLADDADAATGSLGDATEVAKKLKQYTMGFDELNVINPDSGSSGKGGAGGEGDNGWGDGLDLDTLWDKSVLAQASKQIDELKGKIYDFLEKWKTEIAIISTALGALGVAKLLTQLGNALGLGESFLGVMGKIQKFATTAIIITLQYSLMTEFFKNFMSEDGTLWDYVKALLVGAGASWILYSMWGPAGLVIGLGVTAVASLSALIDAGGITDAESATVAITGLASAMGAVGIAWKKVVPAIKESNIVRALQGIRDGSPAASSALSFMFPNISKLVAHFKTATTAVSGFVSGLTVGPILLVAGIITAIVSAGYFLSENWEKVTAAVKAFLETNIVPKLESIKESWERMKEAVSNILPPAVLQWFKDVGAEIGNLIQKVVEWAKSVDWLNGIGKAFEVLGGLIFGVVSTVIAGAFSSLVQIIEGFVQAFSGVVEIITGLVKLIVGLFTGDLAAIKDAVRDIIDGVVNLFIGLWDMVVGPIKAFVEGVIDWFVALWDELVGHSIVPDTINAIVDWFLSLPDKIFGPVEEFVKGIIDRFKGMWTSIQSWWASNVAPKFTKEYWVAKFDVIRSAISEKLAAAKQAVIDKWTEITEWFAANIAPKFTLKFWLDKFSSFKEGFTQTIKNMLNAGIDMINKFIGWLNEKMQFSWDEIKIMGKTVVPAGSVQLFTIPLITQRFADGGFIEDGLFTMNHGEIAGKFSNGQSVVANNQQIVEGIAAGVYEAVVSAMNATSGGQSQNVNVYLDGKQIYASVKKTESERGRTLMGNQLGYAY